MSTKKLQKVYICEFKMIEGSYGGEKKGPGDFPRPRRVKLMERLLAHRCGNKLIVGWAFFGPQRHGFHRIDAV